MNPTVRHRLWHMPESLWSRVADLPLTVEAHAAHPLETQTAEERASYLVRLHGDGAEGLGEDVGGDMLDDNGAFLTAAPALPLAGRWTLRDLLRAPRGPRPVDRAAGVGDGASLATVGL